MALQIQRQASAICRCCNVYKDFLDNVRLSYLPLRCDMKLIAAMLG